jgi:signal transduction histidine kinase
MARISAVLGMTAIVVAATVAEADLSINAVIVDGKPNPMPAGSGTVSGTPESLRIPSTAGRVLFEFGEMVEPTSPQGDASEADPPRPVGARLRYRLDGVEPTWRDTATSGRAMLSFEDEEAGVIGGAEVAIVGESTGWTGVAEESPFVRQSVTAIVPPLTETIRINFVSHYPGPAVGVIGIDDVSVLVERKTDGSRSQHPVPIDVGSQPFSPMSAPKPWVRSGTRLSMSQLRMRRRPDSHPILLIVDDDPMRYGGWYQSPEIDVKPGDRVTVSWVAAWSLGAGGEAEAEYRELKPGTYFFRVGAFYPNGEPSGVETVLPIEVYVPFHLRRDVWAGAAALGLVGAITAGRAANVRRMKRRLAEIEREHALEQERARIARDLHDDVGAGLTEIAVQTDWLRRDVERLQDAEMTGRADRVCQSAVELIRSVDAIVWAVNPKNDTLDRFVGYLTQSADQFVRAAGLGIRLDVPDEVPATPLSGRVRHNLFLIVREAVNNAVKHAQATVVRLRVGMGGGSVTISVEDDGCGFDPTQPADDGRHSGLANMRRRADDIGGTLVLTSRPGRGTRVEITAPLA